MRVSNPAVLVGALILSAAGLAEEKRRSFSEEIVVEPTRRPDGYLVGWHESRSEHFLVDSDLPTWTVTDLIRKLETLRAQELRSLVAEPVVLPGLIWRALSMALRPDGVDVKRKRRKSSRGSSRRT